MTRQLCRLGRCSSFRPSETSAVVATTATFSTDTATTTLRTQPRRSRRLRAPPSRTLQWPPSHGPRPLPTQMPPVLPCRRSPSRVTYFARTLIPVYMSRICTEKSLCEISKPSAPLQSELFRSVFIMCLMPSTHLKLRKVYVGKYFR